jgi:hypothetical protein
LIAEVLIAEVLIAEVLIAEVLIAEVLIAEVLIAKDERMIADRAKEIHSRQILRSAASPAPSQMR